MLIAGNWKMNGLTADGVMLASEIKSLVKAKKRNCEFLVCPPFTLLSAVKKALKGAKVALGAQDCHFNEKGAHTGDVSPLMLADVGCSYVILGHSERRADHGETSELVCKKAVAANKAGLKTVICIGETLEELFRKMQMRKIRLSHMSRFGQSAREKHRQLKMLKMFMPQSEKFWLKS